MSKMSGNVVPEFLNDVLFYLDVTPSSEPNSTSVVNTPDNGAVTNSKLTELSLDLLPRETDWSSACNTDSLEDVVELISTPELFITNTDMSEVGLNDLTSSTLRGFQVYIVANQNVVISLENIDSCTISIASDLELLLPGF